MVRVSDPRAAQAPPGPPLHVPDVPDVPEVPPTRRPAGRGALPVVLLLVGLAVGAGASELRHAQRDRAAEALGAGVLDLRVEGLGTDFGGMQVEDSARGVVLRRELQLRNVGGRSVRVLDATLQGGAMRGGSARDLPHGEAWRVALSGEVDCPGGPPVYAPPGSMLRVRAQTDAGDRTVELPVPPAVLEELQGQAERACGIVAPGDAVVAQPLDVQVGEDSVEVDVAVVVASSAPVDLLDVSTGYPGLRVAVRTGGRPPVFPFRLPSGGPFPRTDIGATLTSTFQAVISVEDCDLVPGADGQPYGGGSLLQLMLRVGDTAGDVMTEVYDPGGVDQLVQRVC